MAATAAEHDHTSLALATWALGKLAHSPSAQLAAALRRRMAELAAACNPQNLTNFVSGFAMMGCPLTGDDLEVRELERWQTLGRQPELDAVCWTQQHAWTARWRTHGQRDRSVMWWIARVLLPVGLRRDCRLRK